MNIEELRALARSASQGRWVYGHLPICQLDAGTMVCAAGKSFDSNVSHAITGLAGNPQSEADAAYIAAACPEVMLELLAELDRLTATHG